MFLVDFLIKEGYLSTASIIAAFRQIKRRDFILPEYYGREEENVPLPIGFGQTVSQPMTVAFMLEKLMPVAGDRILDVGSGSGWTSALLAELIGLSGRVFALESNPELLRIGRVNADKYNFVSRGRIKFFLGDGWEGLPAAAPYDKILVSAAAAVWPEKLLAQLAVGGRIVAPLGRAGDVQEIVVMEKLGDKHFSTEHFPGFVFVPLTKSKV